MCIGVTSIPAGHGHKKYVWLLSRVNLIYMSLITSKPAFCICENKDADHLRGNREDDQRLCFRYTDSTIPLLIKSVISNQIGNQNVVFFLMTRLIFMYFSKVSALFCLKLHRKAYWIPGLDTIRVYTVSRCGDARMGRGHASYSLSCWQTT